MKRGKKGVSILLTATLAVSGPVSVPVMALADEADVATTPVGLTEEQDGEETPVGMSEEGEPAAQAEDAAEPVARAEDAADPAAQADEPAAQADAPSVEVSTYAELKTALAAASKDAANPTRIQLNADIEATTTAGMTVVANTFVELFSAPGKTYTITQTSGNMTSNQGVFLVNGSLVLSNVVVNANGKGRGAFVAATGSLTMNSGAVITGGAVTGTNTKDGLGVYVNGTTTANGLFTMNEGAKITNCTANLSNYQALGLAVYTKGRFVMNGGEISGCSDAMTQTTTTNYAQGTVYVISGVTSKTSALAEVESFVMNGGTISGNTANHGGAIFFGSYALATLNKGTIENNTARFAGGALAMVGSDTGSTLRNTDVYVGPDVVLRNNTATIGGAIYASKGVLQVEGASITGNKAVTDRNICPSHLNSATSIASSSSGFGTSTAPADGDGSVAAGGGIYIADCLVIVTGATITGNSATSSWTPEAGSTEMVFAAGNGGGVYVSSSKGCTIEHGVTLKDSTITGNSASGPGALGGNGGDVCASLNPYDGGVDILLLEGGTGEGEGLHIGSVGAMNAMTYRYQQYSQVFESVTYGAPQIALSGNVTIDSVKLPAPVADEPATAVALFALGSVGGKVGFDVAALELGTPVLLGANGYLLRTADLNKTAVSPAAAGKALGFNQDGNVVVADAANPQFDITDTAEVSVASAVYSGQEVRPAVTVTVNGKVLEASDYSVAYANNTEVGTATVVVNGRGAYQGTVEAQFSVQPRSLTAEGVSVANPGTFYATGDEIKPTPVVSDGAVALVQGTDYEVAYRDNVAAGTATMTITGTGNYGGTVEVAYTIKAVPDTMRSVRNETELRAALADATAEGIVLAADFSVADTVTISRPVVITGDGHRITYNGSGAENLIEVAAGGALTLSDTALTSTFVTASTAAANTGTRTLYVREGGSAVLSQVELQGMRTAAGVSLYNAGAVTMTDVVVKDANNNSTTASKCYEGILYNAGAMKLGSGVRFESSSRKSLVMNTGALEIDGAQLCKSLTATASNNSVPSYGAALTTVGGAVVMNDGLMSDNTVGAAVMVKGGGLFTMNGGRIVDNKQSTQTGTVFVYSLASETVTSKFVMNGGIIANNNNTANGVLSCDSGGVYVNGPHSEFEMNGGEISGNSAFQGGGVGVNGGTFTMNGGTIKDNLATSTNKTSGNNAGNKGYAQGGGVSLFSNATFTMNGGTIEGNTAELKPATITSQVDFDFTGLGGGVYVMGSTFTMNGGTITNNTAAFDGPTNYVNSGLGGGVYVADQTAAMRSTVTLNGTITGNHSTGRGVLTHSGDGADVYVDRVLNLASTAVNGSPTVNVGGDFTAGEVKLAGTATYLTVTSPFASGAGITHLVADDRNTAGSQVAKVAEGVTLTDAMLKPLGYDSLLGLAISKDDPSKIVLGALDLASANVQKVELTSTQFTGKPINPSGILDAIVTLKNGEQVTVTGLNDITVTQNTAHTEPGTVSVTLKGEGGLVVGQTNATYTIEPRSLTAGGFTAQLGDQILTQASTGKFSYTGEAFPANGQQLTPTVKLALDTLEDDNGAVWIDPKYFTVEYGANTVPGTGSVTITAKEGVAGQRYQGSTTVSFSICGKSMADLTSNVPAQTTYTGSYQYRTTQVKLYDADGNELKYTTDYTVATATCTNVGKYTIDITGKGDYLNRKLYIDFEIVPINLEAEGVVTLSATEFPYTGNAITAPTRTISGLSTATLMNNNSTLTYTDADGNEVASTALSAAGKYYAVVAGKEYSGYSNVVGTARIPFYIGLESLAITGAPATGACREGDEFTLGYSTLPANPTQMGELTWTSSNPAVATVDASGHVKGVGKGTTVITASAGGQTSSFTLTVARAMLTDCDIDWGEESFVYDGTAKQPQVKLTHEGATLVAGTDYTVSYENNVNAGTATVTIVGDGSEYGGTITREFTIDPASIAGRGAQLAFTSAEYSGEPICPAVTIPGLVEGVDFEVEYNGNCEAGKAVAVVTGMGNYENYVLLEFEIEQASLASFNVRIYESRLEYDPWEGNCPRVLTDGLVQGEDYRVSATNSGKYGTAALGNHTVTVEGCGNYQGTVSLPYEVVATSIAKAQVSGIKSEYAPSSAPIVPTVELIYGNGSFTDTLVKGIDYVVDCYNNIEEGTATMVITGIGGFSGTKMASFLIKQPTVVVPGGDGTDSGSGDNSVVDGPFAPGSIVGGSNGDGGLSSSAGGATVSGTGVVAGRAAGSTTPVGGISVSGTGEPGEGAEGEEGEDGAETDADGMPLSLSATQNSASLTRTGDDGTELPSSNGDAIMGEDELAQADWNADLIALVTFLVLACGTGGFLLFRYLTARKPEGEVAEAAPVKAKEAAAGVY